MADRPPYPGMPRWVKVSGIILIVLVLLVVIIMLTGVGGEHGPGRHMPSGGAGGGTPPRRVGGDMPPDAEPVRARFASYTVEQAAREGYVRNEFCLDAAAFGQPAERGAMGFHATNETLLRGPIESNRPQALLFDAQGRVLGVEYEVMTDTMSECPSFRASSDRRSSSSRPIPASSTSITRSTCGSSRTPTGHVRMSTPACRVRADARLGIRPAGEGLR